MPELRNGKRITKNRQFAFGRNWSAFLRTIDESAIAGAVQSLRDLVDHESIDGRSFLDVGSGSGLFSLAARRLGATVMSFDSDPLSVACTLELKQRCYPEDSGWRVQEGSILDEHYVAALGQFDVVYSWGVLHHTGNMHAAFDNIAQTVARGGRLCLAIYNDQGRISRYWAFVKRTYNRGAFYRCVIVAMHAPYLLGLRYLYRAVTGRLVLERGMSLWHDMIDWLGGSPFEVAKPEVVILYFKEKRFTLEKLRTCGGRMGCNEFVFRRIQ
jgi:2-polyprenyl-6-hydroxyphenyl methylase/3-demethylubiquinone-9 3-methyltransferase